MNRNSSQNDDKGKAGPATGRESPRKAARLPVPTRVPHRGSISDLYPSDDLVSQRRRYERIRGAFFAHFPERAAAEKALGFYSSPGRTELCGNHTDHNRGKVLAAAIQFDTVAVVAPRDDSIARIVSEGFGEFKVDISDHFVHPEEKGRSQAIVRGIASRLSALSTDAGRRPKLKGFDAYIQSDVLPGSGLSSSASFEVLIGSILAETAGLVVSPAEIAAIGQFAENQYFGKPCGLMDQMTCALGNIAAIDFRDPEKAEVELLPFDVGRFGLALVIVNTGGSHADLTEDYAAIPEEMKAVAALLGKPALRGTSAAELFEKAPTIRASCGDRAFLRAFHFVKENERPDAMAKAILSGDIGAYLDTVKESGASSWKYLQNLFPVHSPAEQGLGVALAITEDFLAGEGACRVHGGGFAGTIQAYIPLAKLARYKALMEFVFGSGTVFALHIRPYGVVCVENIERSV